MEAEEKRGIVVATYNALADAYVRPEYFPKVDPALFVAAKRYPRIADRVLGLAADVVCMQEVDKTLYALLGERLAGAGYRGHWAQKGSGKPDGCATFVRAPWSIVAASRLAYDDGTSSRGRSGHVALVAIVARGGHRLTVVNTHLKWDAPETPEAQRLGHAQAKELARLLAADPSPRVLCGDFNAELGGPILNAFVSAGFSDAHPTSAATNNAGGVARKIDFLLHSADLAAQPRETPPVADGTPLPSETEPSDHVPLVATFR